MTISELIKKLKTFPKETPVRIWDIYELREFSIKENEILYDGHTIIINATEKK
jgi:hypothetical protein